MMEKGREVDRSGCLGVGDSRVKETLGRAKSLGQTKCLAKIASCIFYPPLISNTDVVSAPLYGVGFSSPIDLAFKKI